MSSHVVWPRTEGQVLDNGTTIYAAGSGARDFVELFASASAAQLSVRGLPWWARVGSQCLLWAIRSRWLGLVWRPRFGAAHQLDMAIVFTAIGEVSAYESIVAEIKAHFGQLLEIGRGTQEGFEKLPSATIITEIVTYQNNEATLYPGSYLNYAYDGDILVYRRFGEIRRDELHQAFGTDYIAGAAPPLLQQPSSAETNASLERLLSKRIFNDAVVQIISYNDLGDISNRKTSFSEPDHANLRIERVNDHFEMFRSHEFMKSLADRLGVKKVTLPSS